MEMARVSQNHLTPQLFLSNICTILYESIAVHVITFGLKYRCSILVKQVHSLDVDEARCRRSHWTSIYRKWNDGREALKYKNVMKDAYPIIAMNIPMTFLVSTGFYGGTVKFIIIQLVKKE